MPGFKIAVIAWCVTSGEYFSNAPHIFFILQIVLNIFIVFYQGLF